eukprot:Gb_18353 [translate_table: standard]
MDSDYIHIYVLLMTAGIRCKNKIYVLRKYELQVLNRILLTLPDLQMDDNSFAVACSVHSATSCLNFSSSQMNIHPDEDIVVNLQ